MYIFCKINTESINFVCERSGISRFRTSALKTIKYCLSFQTKKDICHLQWGSCQQDFQIQFLPSYCVSLLILKLQR